MSKIKKISISLGIMFSMVFALVAALVFNFNTNQSQSVGDVGKVQDSTTVTKPKAPTTFTYDASQITFKQGGDVLNYSYNPSDVQGDPVVTAYEYPFGNSGNKELAVNLKEIDTTGVTVSYAWSKYKLGKNPTVTTYTNYECQTLPNKGDMVYIYIFVTPENTEIPAEFSKSVVWYCGEAQELPIFDNDTDEVTYQTIVSGQKIDAGTLTYEERDDATFEGWYLDKECTQPVGEVISPNAQLYTRYYTLPNDRGWLTKADDHYVVTKGTGSVPTDLVIPAYYDGLPVTHIGQFTFENFNLTSVTLPGTLTSIGEQAFYGCSNLTTVDLSKCINLSNIELGAFRGCNSLVTMDLSQCVEITNIPGYIFSECRNLQSVILPEFLTNIGYNTFSDCESLITIEIPSSVTNIENSAFSGCSELKSVTFEAGGTWYYCLGAAAGGGWDHFIISNPNDYISYLKGGFWLHTEGYH